MEQIRSRKNQYILHLRALAKSADARREAGEYVCDGEKLLREALQFGAEVTSVLWREAAAFSLPDGIAQYAADAELVEYASPLMHSPGPVFTVRIPAMPLPDPLRRVIVLEGVQDPGNVGTLLRSAAAFGFDGVLLSKGCAAPFAPKTLRASMGAAGRLPVAPVQDLPQALQQLRARGVVCLAAALYHSRPLDEAPQGYPDGLCAVIGSEGQGLTDAAVQACDMAVRIPMTDLVESLNAGVAGSVLLWHFRGV